jgi:hypothetical protein
MPQTARDLAADRMERWAATRPLSQTFADGIKEVATYLRDRNQQPRAQDIEAFQQFTNDLDRSRRQKISDALPEFYRLWCSRAPWDQGLRHGAECG